MTTAATHNANGNTTEATLFVAFELSEKTWKLGFTTGHGQKPRERDVPARDQQRVLDEIAKAKGRLGLPETAPVVSCYEAGREGFWRIWGRWMWVKGCKNPVQTWTRPTLSEGLDHGIGHFRPPQSISACAHKRKYPIRALLSNS